MGRGALKFLLSRRHFVYFSWVADKDRFYAAYTQSFKGPFKPAKVIVDDESNDAQVLLDDNHRQDPFVSIINQ